MAIWSESRIKAVIKAAKGIRLDEQPVSVDSFVVSKLNLSIGLQAQLLDVAGKVRITSELSQYREVALRKVGDIPNYVVFQDANNSFNVSGLLSYLHQAKVDAKIIERLKSHSAIVSHLRSMKEGHDLEAVSSAVLDCLMDHGFATRGSGDQGVDAVGIKEILKIDSSFADGTAGITKDRSTKIFAIVSSKQHRFKGSKTSKVINPTFIRELIGGWMLQRSTDSAWKGHGLQILSPIQMVLATTYRLSDDSMLLCRSMGIQVWGMPQLVFLIACAAPDAVFANQGGTFSARGFSNWWKRYDTLRLSA